MSQTGPGESVEWRPVLGYEGSYEVSCDGRVRSIPRKFRGRSYSGKELKPGVNVMGYHYVVISKDAVPKHRTVHSLVAEAFIGARPEGAVTRHLDGDRLNNASHNLAWGTQSENLLDAVAHGTNQNSIKDRCSRGHLFNEVNVKRFRSHGNFRRRECKSCWLARAVAHSRGRGGDEDFIVEYSNMKYAEMGLR